MPSCHICGKPLTENERDGQTGVMFATHYVCLLANRDKLERELIDTPGSITRDRDKERTKDKLT